VKLTGKCAAPQSHVQIDEATGKPMVSWEKVNGAKQYTVYRSTDKFSGFKKLGTTKTLSYIDTKAEVGKTYFYTVVANASSSKYSSGQSYPMGATAICAQPAVKITVGASGKPQLTWGKVAGAVRYEIWLEQAGAKELLAETTAALFEDETAYPGETKIYWVYAIDAQGERNGNWFVATATCAAPKLTSHLTDDGKPSGWWDEIEGATAYKVYRSTKSTSGFKLLEEIEAGLGSEFFIDDSAVKGKTYYYKVVAVCADESGEEVESPYSNTIKVKSK
jgi:fibronectin type 3 domain-containing protein